MKSSLKNFYFRMLVRVLKENKVYNDKKSKEFLKEIIYIIENKIENEPPHLFFSGRYGNFHLKDVYIEYIIDKYVSDLCEGLEYHLNEKLTKLDFIYLKENIKACKLYWSIRSRYKIKEDDIHKIINKYCYDNDSEKFICKSFKRN